jgi:hypothetical protein
MRQPDTATGNQLANALNALGINFILGGIGADDSLHRQPARLIAALAMNEEARLRLSLIPLFLEHPEYAGLVRAVARKLGPAARLTLQCYYSAAVWFQQKYQSGGIPLPDHFSGDLGLEPVEDPDENLRALAQHHKELSGSFTNRLATYQHAVQVWRKGLEYRKA